ncbi:glucosamine-6-phosphate deaminase [Ohessyouella blattaphilus]|uniref:Glucosamine-6-phosphate deaminase n=1 Tax=Ohessyouella blattaphilus TaxID=2949333 RepID=A0ABT1EFN3_9FIRM|nr:glucosamine-6-phosphate deaminase [Ohessyouella blattaphilus]MCP1109515.1 glucosamine-6-phosphate deaminase [Ohessyouella blattaphilus]MCR8562909.1 glucosamine-6-phosphate deaminase [Ohessyouella blattaphilus]MDL2250097.1 glucosamine-6-phosphate deaminase [Lachnospiraceae bacterium OttesenSCG-928-J05]
MKVVVCKDYEEMSQKAAESVAQSIKENPGGLISFPGGDTPLLMVHRFAEMVNGGAVDISKTHYTSLDEWVGLADTDEGSCGLFNRQQLFERLEKPFAGTHLINGAATDIEKERQELDDYIAEYGPLDVSVLGIGLNGHLGFNESGVDFDWNAHIITLDETTRRVMKKYFGEKFHPTQGITQGIAQIMAAKKVILIANGAHKADIIHRAVYGQITPEVPASVLQKHPNCYVIVDQEAGAKL